VMTTKFAIAIAAEAEAIVRRRVHEARERPSRSSRLGLSATVESPISTELFPGTRPVSHGPPKRGRAARLGSLNGFAGRR
jgi:hypothetical protein